jgi:hypothetical protein
MTTRYESTHVTGDDPMTLIFPEGMYETVPYEIRLLGPWCGCSFGDMASLKPAQRADIFRQGYTIVREASMLDAA